jgi:hypothetical protein
MTGASAVIAVSARGNFFMMRIYLEVEINRSLAAFAKFILKSR